MIGYTAGKNKRPHEVAGMEKDMAVKRIVANIGASNIEAANSFYGGVLGMDVVMDLGWIVTFAADAPSTPQVSVATEGGSGTAVPDLSIEVDNLDDVYRNVRRGGVAVEYGPASEPWGARLVRPSRQYPQPRLIWKVDGAPMVGAESARRFHHRRRSLSPDYTLR